MGETGTDGGLGDYALVVGISYPAPDFSGLLGTNHDAAAFLGWLVCDDGGKVPAKNIEQVLSPPKQGDPERALPRQQEIELALERFGVDQEPKQLIGRRLYVYFTGHGYGGEVDEVGMLMAHANREEYVRNIGLREYRNFFHRNRYFLEIVYVIDCCRDAAPPDSGAALQAPTWKVAADEPLNQVNDLVILAAQHGKKAHETIDPESNKHRGLMTLALLDVLRGREGVDADGRHTGFTIGSIMLKRMQVIAAANPTLAIDQEPMINQTDIKAAVVLAPAPLPTVPVRIIVPAGAEGEFVVLKGTTDEIARCSAAQAAATAEPWLVKLVPTTFYSVRKDMSPLFAPINWEHLEATKEDAGYVFVFPDA